MILSRGPVSRASWKFFPSNKIVLLCSKETSGNNSLSSVSHRSHIPARTSSSSVSFSKQRCSPRAIPAAIRIHATPESQFAADRTKIPRNATRSETEFPGNRFAAQTALERINDLEFAIGQGRRWDRKYNVGIEQPGYLTDHNRCEKPLKFSKRRVTLYTPECDGVCTACQPRALEYERLRPIPGVRRVVTASGSDPSSTEVPLVRTNPLAKPSDQHNSLLFDIGTTNDPVKKQKQCSQIAGPGKIHEQKPDGGSWKTELYFRPTLHTVDGAFWYETGNSW